MKVTGADISDGKLFGRIPGRIEKGTSVVRCIIPSGAVVWTAIFLGALAVEGYAVKLLVAAVHVTRAALR